MLSRNNFRKYYSLLKQVSDQIWFKNENLSKLTMSSKSLKSYFNVEEKNITRTEEEKAYEDYKRMLWEEYHKNIGSERMRKIVKDLQNIPQYAQRSENWYKSRKTRITASEAASVIPQSSEYISEYLKFFDIKDFKENPKKMCNPYQSKKDFLKQKCGLKEFTGNIATRWGQMLEDVATGIYKRVTNREVIEFGLIEDPERDYIGASPDGITDTGVMLEIKCPFKRKITGVPPMYYWIQMQMQLEVCKLDICDYLECTFDQEFTWRGTKEDFLKLETSGVREIEYRDTFKKRAQVENQALEKGVIVKMGLMGTFENTKYYYPDPKLNAMEQLRWAEEFVVKLTSTIDIQRYLRYKNLDESIKKTITFNEYKASLQKYTIKPVYWKLTDIHIATVLRSKKWFNQIDKLLKDSHKEMTETRDNKELFEELKASIRKPKEENPKTEALRRIVFTESEAETKTEKPKEQKKEKKEKKQKDKKETIVKPSKKERTKKESKSKSKSEPKIGKTVFSE